MNDLSVRCSVSSTVTVDAWVGPTTNASRKGATAPLLPDPLTSLMNSGDPGAIVAALVAKSGQAARSVHEQVRRSEDASQEIAEQRQVHLLHEEATTMRQMAVVSGACAIASGALTAGAAGASAQSDSLKGNGALLGAAHMKTASTQMTALSSGLGTVDKLASGLMGAHIKSLQASGAEAQHAAARAARNIKNADEGISDANRLIDKALAFFKEYSSAKDQTAAAATHRM